MAKESAPAPWPAREVAEVSIKDLPYLYELRLKTATFWAITLAMRHARQKAIEYVRRYFPSSKGSRPGHYQRDVIATVREGAGEQDPWFLLAGAPYTDYAMFVDAMRGVQWTNPRTVEGVQGLFVMYARQLVRDMVKATVLSYALTWPQYQHAIAVTGGAA
jgi:hypothetical protein